MKRTISILLLLTATILTGAETKVALTGLDEPGRRVAELAIAELSDDFEFVERQEIDLVKREFSLQESFALSGLARKLNGAALLAVVENRTLTVFETDCGFRLSRKPLPEDHASAIREVRQRLTAAIELSRNPEQNRFVSMAGIRNNLHNSLRDKAKALTDELSLRTDTLEATWLERDYLIELLRERQLSGKWARAVAASEILHFELNPGDSANSIVIVGYFTDADEKIMFRHQTNEDIGMLFARLSDYLNQAKAPAAGDLRPEARRFAREAELSSRKGDNLTATKQYFAAYALDHENMQYLLKVDRSWYGNITPVYPYWKAVIERYLENPPPPAPYESETPIDRLLAEIWQHRHDLPGFQQKKHWEFVASIREKIVSGTKLERFRRTVQPLYPTKTDYLDAKLAAWNELLAEMPADPYPATGEIFALMDALPAKSRRTWTEQSCRQLTREDLKPLAYILQCNDLLYSPNYTQEKAAELFEAYFKAARASGRGGPQSCSYYSRPRVAMYPGLDDIIKNLEKQYRGR